MNDAVIGADEAVELVEDNAVVAIQGSGGGVGEPSCLIHRLGEKFRTTKHPENITVVHSTGLGDRKEIGMDYLAQEGLVKRDIAGHLGMAPQMGKLIQENKVEAYNFPQGVLSHMFHAVAAKTPGVITKVGLNTFVDPRIEGGKMNSIAKEDFVRVLEIDGEEWLFYPRLNFNVAFVRGTTADTFGNITSEEEGAPLESLTIAQAVKNCGGTVIAQVKYLADKGSLRPQDVRIPGIYVDHIVVDPEQKQTAINHYDPGYSGRFRVPLDRVEPLPLDAKKVIARRAAQELFEGAVVNLGYGTPDGVAAVAAEEGKLDEFTLTVEQGPVGGRPAGGVIFGVAYNPEAILRMDDQFTFYDGGGIDLAFLGMAEVDESGNVNSSKVGKMLAGCGGFINITQNAKNVFFCGTFSAKKLKCDVGKGKITIINEGEIQKFVEQVNQITFSGVNATGNGQPVLYITERAVFRLTENGLELIEIAPGIDLERDILGQMRFKPIVSSELKTMDESLFRA